MSNSELRLVLSLYAFIPLSFESEKGFAIFVKSKMRSSFDIFSISWLGPTWFITTGIFHVTATI